MVFTSALILIPLCGKKEQPQSGSGFADDGPANPVAGFSRRRCKIHPLLEERAGVRTDVNHAGMREVVTQSWELNCCGQAGKPGIESKS